jgi:hypothetical protein
MELLPLDATSKKSRSLVACVWSAMAVRDIVVVLGFLSTKGAIKI